MSNIFSTRIQLYGKLRDFLGSEIEIVMPHDTPVSDLRKQVSISFPEAGDSIQDRRVRVCVGDTIVAEDYRVCPGDDVAFLSPVSGG